jgi:opacity protein-like surface antigen
MRALTTAGALAIALSIPAVARAQNGQFQGFGGLTFGDVTSSSTFGGSIAVPLGGNLQIIGEGGRMTDVVPSLLGTIVDLTPVDLRVSAWYGEGGLRFIAPGGAVRPYVETTAGFARLTTVFTGVGSVDPFVNTGLRFLDSTEPMLGAGGGVLVHGGPLVVDLGYRYKRILAGDSLQGLLTGGDFSVNQVRLGIGVRF